MNTNQKLSSRCSCGTIEIKTTAQAIFRAYCHCTICQKFNGSDFADVTAFYAGSVQPFDDSNIDFKVYKQPPLVQRGICTRCSDPVVERINIPLMPKLIMVPSQNFESINQLPTPSLHIFYDKRVNDIDDNLRKYHGFIPSQLGFAAGLLKGMLVRA